MYKNYIGKYVSIIAATAGANNIEYLGELVEEKENCVVLKNADIKALTMASQRSMFGGLTSVRDNVSELTINKAFIISCALQN